MNCIRSNSTIRLTRTTLICSNIVLMAFGAKADELRDRANKVTIANSEHQDSLSLLLAAGKALGEGRVEDAGFLYYAGQIRARVDLDVFEPVGEGGNSPGVLLAAMKGQLGSVINPVVMRDRNAYARIVARLAKWTPKFDAGYDPGWEYKLALTDPKVDAAIKETKEPMLARMQALSQLLQDDEYYRSFKTVQDYNLGGDAFPPSKRGGQAQPASVPPSEADFMAAMDQLKQIETTRGIKSGLFPDKEDLKNSRKTNYKVLADRVTYHGWHTVVGADPASFKVMDDVDYARDARQVFVLGQAIPGADPNTFQVLDGYYARDKSNIYCGNVKMNVANIDRFEIVHAGTGSSGMGAYELEDHFLFETGMTLDSVGLSTGNLPVMAADSWARDGEWYYHGCTKVESADYASFQVIDGSSARDKDQEYTGAFTREEWTTRRHTILKIR